MEIKKSHNSFDRRGFTFVVSLLALSIALFASTHFAFSSGLITKDTPLVGSLAILLEATNDASGTPAIAEAKEDEKEEDTRSSRVINIKSIEESVPESGKFVGADLQAMKLYLYEDGVLKDELEILSKGRTGSKWETPSGQYEVLYKNESHFSSIGEVYMPYSMQFYGNFFIHGWPYYPDGTEVGQGYSGGCIRLSTPDSKIVFEFADMHTPIYVFDSEVDTSVELTAHDDIQNVPVPRVSAKAFLIADIETGEVLAEKNASLPYPIASISKLMTAVVANETISFDRLIPVSQNAFDTYGSQGGIEVGERFTIGEMYYPLLLNSSNDAATAIAEYYNYNSFITMMNQKARALEMNDSSFEDPSGLSPQNISTANDLFKLSRYIENRKNFIFEITTKMSETLPANDYTPSRTYTSNNPMRGRGDFIGGKNGFTDEARKTLLSLFSVKDDEGTRKIAVIVLGSEDHTNDTLKLLEWAEKALN